MNWDNNEKTSPKTHIPELFKAVDENKRLFVENLKEAISIPSVSHDADHFNDILKMLNLCAEKLEDLGASVNVVNGNDKNSTNLPPVLFANLFLDDEYKTICVYGNIDTVLPSHSQSKKSFELIEEKERLYGCGVSDNKAPLFCWFNALKIYKMTKKDIPVNIKFIIEGTSELYSKSLFNAISRKREFFNNVEYICLTIDKKVNEIPCLKYGYRGICYFTLLISCGEKRVHSGTYGGAFNQPLMDAINILGSLSDKNGKIVLTDFLNDIRPITEEDEKRCKSEFCPIESLKKKNGIVSFNHKEIPSRLLMHKTCLPSITVHAFHIKSMAADREDIASMPNKIEAKFSIRLVPNQNVDRTFEQFKKCIEELWHKYKSANTYLLRMKLGFDPWQGDPSSDHYKAAAAAIKTVYKKSPIYISEGSTVPAISILSTTCSASNILVMPISGHDDCLHSNSESISTDNYIKGIKLAIAYMCEIHELSHKDN